MVDNPFINPATANRRQGMLRDHQLVGGITQTDNRPSGAEMRGTPEALAFPASFTLSQASLLCSATRAGRECSRMSAVNKKTSRPPNMAVVPHDG